MDKIQKFLRTLSSGERKTIETVIAKLVAGEFEGLDVKKLKGIENIFRVRKGSVRVLYTFDVRGVVTILGVARRSDTTYNL